MRNDTKKTTQVNVPYLEYTSTVEGSRKMIVLDGQPYYCSTGDNSGLPGTWLPFIMCRGTKLPDDTSNLQFPSKFQHDAFKNLLQKTRFSEGYIINAGIPLITSSNIELSDDQIAKINDLLMEDLLSRKQREKLYITKEHINFDGVTDRFLTKKDVINSSRLGGGIWQNEKIKNKILSIVLDADEIKACETRVMLFNNPSVRTNNPDETNAWLISSGASDLREILHKNQSYFDRQDVFSEILSPLYDLIRNLEEITSNNLNVCSSRDYVAEDEHEKNNRPYKKLMGFLDLELLVELEDKIDDKLANFFSIEAIQGGAIGKCVREIKNEIEKHDIFKNTPSEEHIDSIIKNCEQMIREFKKAYEESKSVEADLGNLKKTMASPHFSTDEAMTFSRQSGGAHEKATVSTTTNNESALSVENEASGLAQIPVVQEPVIAEVPHTFPIKSVLVTAESDLSQQAYKKIIKSLEIGIIGENGNKKWDTAYFGGVDIQVKNNQEIEVGSSHITATMNSILDRITKARLQIKNDEGNENEIYKEALVDIKNIFDTACHKNNGWQASFFGRKDESKKFYKDWSKKLNEDRTLLQFAPPKKTSLVN